MGFVAAAILVATIGLALTQPNVGGFRISHAWAAVAGGVLTVACGLVTPGGAVQTLEELGLPLVTIVSLMVITIISERAGLLERLAAEMARAARGSGFRLLVLVFACGTATGAVFTNDAAVLIFTPLVLALVEDVREDDWTLENQVPFYFAVLYVGNLVGPLVISNPINIIVAGIFEISFLEYAVWMMLPALVSMAVTLAGLWWFFRDVIPVKCRIPDIEVESDARLTLPCIAVLAATLLGFFSEAWTGVPVWLVAVTGAIVLTVIAVAQQHSIGSIIGSVGWDVLVFVSGIFVVVRGLRNVGFSEVLGDLIVGLAGTGLAAMSMATALVAGLCSSLMNNHPTAGLMTWVIRDFGRPVMETNVLVYSALIGGDLGPKMLPIGSLAALLWFGILRRHGVEVPYSLYIKIGIPVTLAAIVASVLTLSLEVHVFG